MKRILAILIAVLLLLCCCAPAQPIAESSEEEMPIPSSSEPVVEEVSAPVEEPTNGEMIVNGGFDNDMNEWYAYYESGGASKNSVENGMLKVDFEKIGFKGHSVQIYQDILSVEEGCRYRMSFDMYATVPRTICVRVQKNGGDYYGYLEEYAKITTEMQHYEFEFKMDQITDPAPRVAFNIGKYEEDGDIGPHQLYLDNVSLIMYDDSEKIVGEDSGAVAMPININQLGYRPQDSKIAVFSAEDSKFDVVDVKTGSVVFSGNITGNVQDAASVQTVRYGDFSALTTPGEYKIKTEKLGESFPFTIADSVYDSAFADVLNFFYIQRCGKKLSADTAQDWAHKACHTGLATVYGTTTKLDVSGGWHDAGDYGRYVVPGAKAAADLMLAYQLNPQAFADPASSSVPAILEEVRYELDWMLKMQDKETGGVYHKVTTMNFEGEVMPDEVTEELYLSPISTTATATFAAVMAMASEVYKPYDAAFAKKCLAAAEKAWGYTLENSYRTFKNPVDIVTGEYPDNFTEDERFWAASELLKVTGKKEYNDEIVKLLQRNVAGGLGWANTGFYGYYAYLTTLQDKVDAATAAKIKEALLAEANKLLQAANADGYLISLGTDYAWGSNMTVANNAMLLLLADKIAPNDAYKKAAANHLNYLFGTNCLSYSYVTGHGSQSPDNTHHRPSMAAEKTVPGMLVGGPNKSLEDPYARAVLKGLAPAQCYADSSQSYSTNEVTIYWNSPLVFLMSYFAKAY